MGRDFLVGMEGLDGRVMLSASVSAGGTLTVEGTRRADVIAIYVSATNSRRAVVSVNGVGAVFSVAAIKRIYVLGGLGNDQIDLFDRTGSGGEAMTQRTTIFGGDGDDVINGSQGDNVIAGEGGNDQVGTHDGNDTLDGGDGVDSLLSGNGANVVLGGAGRDNLIGGTGNDSISGGAGADFINGGDGGRDTLEGDHGADVITGSGSGGVIRGGVGDDTMTGGEGLDLFGGEGFDDFSTPAVGRARDAEIGDVIRLR